MKKSFTHILFYVLLVVAVIFGVTQLMQGLNSTRELENYSEVVEAFQVDRVRQFYLKNDNTLILELYPVNDDGTVNLAGKTEIVSHTLSDVAIFYNDCSEIYRDSLEHGNLQSFQFQPNTSSLWGILIPAALVLLLIIVLFVYAARQSAANGGGGPRSISNFGKARVKTPASEHDTVKFTDVAGADEEKAELEEVVEFLRDPSKFTRLGARIPHGVLLVGPPGTGKTLLAKAVAGEAGVPFLSISGSDFVEMYVGVGASRVRDLFETARKAPAAIIFIDEIDAVGRHRGAGLGGGHDEREQTLNQLLVEMDGFGSHDGIIVMAATNRPDILDPALLRPGRFDRQITVNIPDINGREAILKVHAKNKPLEPTVDLREVASSTVGFTGADLANLLNEAALLAARRGKSLIGTDDITDAYFKIIMGPKKKSLRMSEKERKNTAYHEAGHAMLSYLLHLDPVRRITIVPSGNALGLTLSAPTEDRYSVYKQELKDRISMMLGGRAAEYIIFGDFSGGASNDIERATKTARSMVMRLGMSDVLGPINYGGTQSEVFLGRDFSNNQDYSDETAARIDEEVHRIVDTAYQNAISLLRENIAKLHFLADYLVKNEVMDGDQFTAVMERENPTTEEIEQIAKDKKEQSEKDNTDRRTADEKARAETLEGDTPAGDAPAEDDGKSMPKS